VIQGSENGVPASGLLHPPLLASTRPLRVQEQSPPMSIPLILRYLDRLPFSSGDPIVTLHEGSTPLVPAPVVSELVGVDVRLKLEGANPTRVVQGSRDDVRRIGGRARPRRGDRVRVDRQHRRERPPPTPPVRGLRGAVIVPEGKIATGKLAQALMHGRARVVSLRGNFDQAFALVRELVERRPIALVNSINPYRLEGQKTAAFEVVEDGGEPDALCIPVGKRGQRGPPTGRASRSWASRPRMLGFQAEGAAPLVLGEPVERPETIASAIRIGNPRALGGGDGRDRRLGRRDPRGQRRRDPRRLPSARPGARASSASRPRPPRWRGCCATAPTTPSGWSACSPATA